MVLINIGAAKIRIKCIHGKFFERIVSVIISTVSGHYHQSIRAKNEVVQYFAFNCAKGMRFIIYPAKKQQITRVRDFQGCNLGVARLR
jgi:hypothetical protein